MLTLSVEVVTLVAFGAVAFHRSRRQLGDWLDDVLRGHSETLAGLTNAALDEDPPDIASIEQALGGFGGLRHPELFQITTPDGRVIAKSRRLGDGDLEAPEQVKVALEPGKGAGFDMTWDNEPYRARLLRATSTRPLPGPGAAAKIQTGQEREFYVAVAESREELNSRLRQMLEYIAEIGAAVLLVSVIALWHLGRWGLLPVSRLSSEVGGVAPSSLEYRVKTDELPPDLRSLGLSINGFIERLKEAFDREKQFVADAAHELGTPIALLKSNIQSALLGPLNAASYRHSLEELLGDVERLEHLSNSLLALSEAEAGVGGADSQETIELRPYLVSLVEQFSSVGQQSAVTLAFEGDQNAFVTGNRTALDRVFGNLLDNAIKHSHQGGRVSVSIQPDGEMCEIWVADDGPGIPPEDVPYLFERFYRVDKSRSRARGGVGLGLAIVRSLCESQGGEIFYRPRPTGGSIFVVRLPRA